MDYHKVDQKDNMKVSVDQKDKLVRPKSEPMLQTRPKLNKGLFGRLVHGLVGPGGLKQVGKHVVMDIVWPGVKVMIADSVTSGINMVLFNGDPRGGRVTTKTSEWGSTRRTPYDKQYGYGPPDIKPVTGRSYSASDYADEYAIASKTDAADVLNSLIASAEKFGAVSIADYYDKIRVPTTFTDNNYGWNHEDLKYCDVVRGRDGWIIKFPPVHLI